MNMLTLHGFNYVDVSYHHQKHYLKHDLTRARIEGALFHRCRAAIAASVYHGIVFGDRTRHHAETRARSRS